MMKQLSKRALAWLPVGLKWGRPYRQQTAFLRRAQYWSPEAIRAWQSQQLQAIVRHAWHHSEGYRELYHKAGITLDDIRDVDDLRYLPTVTKQMLQADIEAFSVPLKGRRDAATGGSTGIPFRFYLTQANLQIEKAYMHAGWRWGSWTPGGNRVVLRGSFVESKGRFWEYDSYRRELRLTASYLSPHTLPTLLDLLHRYQPRTLEAYPSACLILSDLLADYGKPVHLPFRWIMLGSENLYDWQLEKFTRAFPHARLVSWYGHTEKAVLAPWCEHSQRFHCWPFYGLTEVLDEQGREVGEGKEGHLVGTSFHMEATPFIRYETMDRAVKGPAECKDCGRNFQTLSRVLGRLQEVIMTASGRYISMTAMNMHGAVFDPIRQFQFMQEQPGVVTFRYVPKGALSGDEEVRMQQGLQAKLGEDMKLILQPVPEIPYTRRGKLCFLEQRLEIRYGNHPQPLGG